MEIEYRGVDRSNQSEIRYIAEKDSKIPLQYDPDYSWNEKSINGRIDYFKQIKPEDFFEVAVQSNKVIGFHMIIKIPYPPDIQAGIILSLWVDPLFRGQGIGRKLKGLGEQWAKQQGLTFLQTGVHPSNEQVLNMNRKSGFSIAQYTLRKRLIR